MLSAARRSARGTGCLWLDSLVAVTGAGLAFVDGKPQRGVHLLRQGLATARKNSLLYLPMWSPRLFAESCRHALELDIEARFARALIRTHALVPKTPPLEVTSWPWPVRIFTLGRFAVEVCGQPVPAKNRTELKPTSLLKVLVALGNTGVKSSTVADVLWPEADGDAQIINLRTALHRARSLLGNPGAIVMEDGALRLAADLVWVDAWACEHCISVAEEMLGQDSGVFRAAELCERAQYLYRSPFLPNLIDEPWSYGLRDRLQERLVTTVCDVAEHLASCEGSARAMRMTQRLLQTHPRAEEAYRLLMQGYARQGRWSEAMETYRRCEASLALVSMTPSLALQAERAKLRRQLSC
jgi:pentatricopeptide repeat protein